jgi:hypothetical protein
MVQTTGIDGQVTQVSYTAQGDIASWSRAGRTITTEQDMLGRTVLWKSNDGQSIRADYTALEKNSAENANSNDYPYHEAKAQPIYSLNSKDPQTRKMVSKEIEREAGLKAMGYVMPQASVVPMQVIILPGFPPLPIGPISTPPGKPVPVDPTEPGGPTIPAPRPTLPVITLPPITGIPIVDIIIEICTPRVVEYPPGKEEQCKQLKSDFDVAKKAAKGMSCNPEKKDSLDILQDKYDKNMAEAAARDKLNQTCFGGGDVGHKTAADQARRAAQKCKDLM